MSDEMSMPRVASKSVPFFPILAALGVAAAACSASDESGTSGSPRPSGGASAFGSGGLSDANSVGAGGAGTSGTAGSGGTATGSQGSTLTTGGASQAEETGGASVATGGTWPATGGTGPGTGGTWPATGGSGPGTGGTAPNTGGLGPGTGGSGPSTGGTAPSTGGTAPSTGGTAPSTGGTAPSSGGTTGEQNTGGSGDTTGGQGSGGASTGGDGSGGTATVDPNAATHISECIDSLPWGQDNITDRDEIVGVIIRTCEEFAPSGDGWQTYCQMFLVAAINKESSFDATSIVEDAYGGATDPTVGLTQIRFSSTVKDFASLGPIDALERIGCDFPDSVSGDSAQPYLDMMTDPACNVGLGAWYYFIYGSGNGGSSDVWVSGYCNGDGVAGSLEIGMQCHLCGASGYHQGTCNSTEYLTLIKEWFNDAACNGTAAGIHPFQLTLEPEPEKYCG